MNRLILVIISLIWLGVETIAQLNSIIRLDFTNPYFALGTIFFFGIFGFVPLMVSIWYYKKKETKPIVS